jgi:hypothetical protein
MFTVLPGVVDAPLKTQMGGRKRLSEAPAQGRFKADYQNWLPLHCGKPQTDFRPFQGLPRARSFPPVLTHWAVIFRPGGLGAQSSRRVKTGRRPMYTP